MFSMLIKVVFWIINKIASLILGPILTILSIFLGGTITPLFTSFGVLLNIIGTYVLLVVDLLCIPRELFYLLFTTVLGIAGWVVSVRSYFFIVAIYRHFKP